MPNHLTHDEFRTFAMLYAANADGHISADEEALIKELLPLDHYEAIKSQFYACSDAAVIDLLFDHGTQYCATQESRDHLMADMQKVYRQYKNFSPIEREIHHLFKRIFT